MVEMFLEVEGSDSETETPIRIFENDDGCDDNDMIDGIEADLEIETGTNNWFDILRSSWLQHASDCNVD